MITLPGGGVVSLQSETISSAGSGLVFVNAYGTGVTDAFRSAIVAAETYLQAEFSNPVRLNMSFDLQPLDLTIGGLNNFHPVAVSYANLQSALTAHATTADDLLAVASLPMVDPSGGRGFDVPIGMARVLSLAGPGDGIDDSIILNSLQSLTFGPAAVGIVLHEITEGAMGRIGSLGVWGADGHFAPMDLFRFTAGGQRDYAGGRDVVPSFFGVDGAHVTSFEYHSPINASGVYDQLDFADWNATSGDAFGPNAAGSPGVVSAVDLQVMDVLGWTPAAVAPTEGYASSLSDTTRPFGQIATGGSATGALKHAGDREWFRVGLEGGATYKINLTGNIGGGGTLADPFLRLHDASGGLLDSNDDIVAGSQPDSQITFQAPSSGTFYVEAGGYMDAYAGTYRVDLVQTSATPPGGAPTGGDGAARGGPGVSSINGGAGNDTVDGGPGHNELRGGGDVFFGGPSFDNIAGGSSSGFISRDRGADPMSDEARADILHSFQDAGIDMVSQVGADTIVDMGATQGMTLSGVQLATLPSGWIYES